MDELPVDQRGALDSLKASRGACPSAEHLVEYEALEETDRHRHSAHAHITVCARCQLALLHMAEPTGARAASRLRWALPLAATVLLGVGASLVWRSNEPISGGRADEVETIRGTELQPVSPVGATELLREFSWQSPLRADRYRLTVRRGTTVVWQAESTTTRIAAPPPGTIERDVQYEWQVEALDREGNVRMTSPSQSFVVF